MNCIILSGGKAKRMGGTDKACLELNGESFLERKIRLLRPHFDELIIVSNNTSLPLTDEEPAKGGFKTTDYGKLSVVADKKEGIGPLMGIFTGLSESDTFLNFVTTIDTPFTRQELLAHLLKTAEGNGKDATVARWRGLVEPLFAVYAKSCIPAIERTMHKRRTVSFYPEINIEYLSESKIEELDPKGITFFNVNTWEDYKRAGTLLAELLQ